MNNIDKGVIQVLDQLKNSGQLNSYLIDDDERKWTKLIYDIMINKFDMPFGNSTMQQASDIFNNAVRVWKGKNKLGNMMNMESRTMNKKLIRLTEQDLHRIVKASVKRIVKENLYRNKNGKLIWEPAEETKYSIGPEGPNGWPNLLNKDDRSETGYQIYGWEELPDDKRRYSVWNSIARNSEDFIPEQKMHRIVKESVNRILNEGVSFDETIKSIKDLCNDTNMTVEFGQKYVYDGIPTLPVKLTANNADKYDVEEILDYLESYSWVTPPMPKYDRNSYTLIVKGELMPSGANGI